jgi:hypothetical protein
MRHERFPTLFAETVSVLFCVFLFVQQYELRPALAQDAAAEPPSARASSGASNAEYARTVAAAQRAFNLHRWDDALTLFEQAHALKPNARTLRGMGLCLYEQHRYVAAAGYLTQALIDARNPLPSDQRNATADLLARANAAAGSVQLELTPRDAELFVDGAKVEVPESGTLQLDPGHHELSAKAPGYELLIVQVEIASGPNALTLVLPAARRGVAAASAPELRALPEVTPPPGPEPRRRRVKLALTITGAIIAAGGLIGAGGAGLAAVKQGQELHDACPNNACPASQRDEIDHARGLAMASNVLWGVGALGFGLFLTGVLLPQRQEKRDGTTLHLSLTGVDLRGSF